MSTSLATERQKTKVRRISSRGGEKKEKVCQQRDLLSLGFSGPKHEANGFEEKCDSPLPERICLSADLYPSVYFPDLTTSAKRAAIDSIDLVALDFLVGAIFYFIGG
jgi:hypothetical protein